MSAQILALKKHKRDLIIGIGAVIIVAVAFSVASGYVKFTLPFSFAVNPYVKIGISDMPVYPYFGGVNSTLGVFDVYSKFAPNLVTLKQIEFKVKLSQKASQDQNGLRNFSLSYWSCRKSPGPSYGYDQKSCASAYAYPVSVRSTAGYSIITFSGMNLPIASDASSQGFMLRANMAYTGRLAVGNRAQEISVSINDPKEILITSPSSDTPMQVRLGKPTGSWLKIFSGYGYPLRYNQAGVPKAQPATQ